MRFALFLTVFFLTNSALAKLGDPGHLTGTFSYFGELTKETSRYSACIAYVNSNVPFHGGGEFNTNSYKTYGLVFPQSVCTSSKDKFLALIGKSVMFARSSYTHISTKNNAKTMDRLSDFRNDNSEAIFYDMRSVSDIKIEHPLNAKIKSVELDVGTKMDAFNRAKTCLTFLDLEDGSKYGVVMNQEKCQNSGLQSMINKVVPVRLSNLAYIMNAKQIRGLKGLNGNYFYMSLSKNVESLIER